MFTSPYLLVQKVQSTAQQIGEKDLLVEYVIKGDSAPFVATLVDVFFALKRSKRRKCLTICHLSLIATPPSLLVLKLNG